MMKKRMLIVPYFLLLSISALHSQDAEKGKWYLEQRQYRTAEKIFKSFLSKNPNDAKALYYLGKTFIVTGRPDSAEVYFQQGIQADEKYPFNYLGLGIIQLNKSNQPEWLKLYDKGRKYTDNLFEYNVEAGQDCLLTTTKNYDLSEKYLSAAQEDNSTNCRLLTTLGNHYFVSKSAGDAVNEYERAVYYDKNCVQAYVKLGEIFSKANNYKEAITNLNQAIAIDSSQIIAYKDRGDLNYIFGRYDEAKADYKIYMSRSDNTLDDKERYAFILFFDKDYEAAKKLVNQVLQKDSTNTVMFRVAAYIDYESGDYKDALNNIEYFFDHHDTTRFISLDYIYYGNLLLKSGQDSLGTVALENALKLDSTKTDLYEEIATSYAKEGKFLNSNEYYQKMLSLNSPNLANIYYQIGRNYYFAAEDTLVAQDSLSRAHLYQLADSAFVLVAQHSPDSYVGYIWEGRALSRLDPETTAGLAKPAYEKAMTLLEAGDISKVPKLLIECYRYMAFYHYMQGVNLQKSKPQESKEEIDQSVDFWQKILNLDPSDQQAQTAIKNLKKK
jgi:tetratricopeptide (TPR) repeat protein